MADLSSLGKLLVFAGVALAGLGLLFLVAGRLPLVGRLPGDILVQRGTWTFYFPIVTMIVLSVLLALVLNLLARR